MKPSQLYRPIFWGMLGIATAACLCFGSSARAQGSAADGYVTREDRGSQGPIIQEDHGQQPAVGRGNPDDGPVRLARFTYVHGNVTWRSDESAEWSEATVNLPIRQGAQVWVTDGGRAEVQFDDGSLLRLGNGAVATLQTLYSDGEGEFTELKLTDGLAALRLKHEHSVFQIDTPLISVKSTGPSHLRIGAGDGVEVGVRSGVATVEGAQGKATLERGDYLDLADDRVPYDVRALPREDTWEQWNDARDERLAQSDADNREHRLPSNISLVATDLDQYGSWRDEPQYGMVWCPRVATAEWRPYQDGHWTWVNPFGWTWVSSEPWGWAPYHYGTWAHLSRGWAWVPGPVTQCWSPAVVHFTEYDNRVAWCPLAPAEIRYGPALALGFRAGNLALYFSIGRAAVYYPTYGGYCEPRAFNNTIVNRVTYVRNVTNIYNGPSASGRYQNSNERFATNSNTYLASRFIPANSRIAGGVTTASASDFGGRGRYEAAGPGAATLFQRGRGAAAPPAGRAPAAGPAAITPSMQALTPTRTYLPNSHVSSNASARAVFRAPLQPTIERASSPVKTVPGIPNSGRTSAERATASPGRYGGTRADQNPRNPVGSGANGQVRRGDPGAGGAPRDGGDGDLTPAQIRARDARRTLGVGGGAVHPDNTPARTGPGSSGGGAGARPPSDDGRQRAPTVTRGASGSPGYGTGRTGSDPSGRNETNPSGGRYRTPELPSKTDPRRDSSPDTRRSPQTDPPQRDKQPARSSGGDKTGDRSKGSSDSKDKDSDTGGSSSPATGRGRH